MVAGKISFREDRLPMGVASDEAKFCRSSRRLVQADFAAVPDDLDFVIGQLAELPIPAYIYRCVPARRTGVGVDV